jgi:hypothetical protein
VCFVRKALEKHLKGVDASNKINGIATKIQVNTTCGNEPIESWQDHPTTHCPPTGTNDTRILLTRSPMAVSITIISKKT